MADRYFSPEPLTSSQVRLAGPEAHHLLHVARARPGAVVTLFDGAGAEFEAVVENVGRAECTLRILQRRDVSRETDVAVTLAVALPKGERQRWLVEKLTELGVQTLVPLETERSVAEAGPAARARLQRCVVEASKQCGRNRLMQIAEPVAWGKYVSQATPALVRCFADPRAARAAGDLPRLLAGEGRPGVVLAVGPEGGFTPGEFALAEQAGWLGLALGPAILRVETAAIALAVLAMSSPSLASSA